MPNGFRGVLKKQLGEGFPPAKNRVKESMYNDAEGGKFNPIFRGVNLSSSYPGGGGLLGSPVENQLPLWIFQPNLARIFSFNF